MRCAVHSDVDAVGYCRNCGKPLCPVCIRPVRDVFYCEECLAKVMGLPEPTPYVSPQANAPVTPGATPPPPNSAATNPAISFVLGFVPGLGAVYNGEYNKALIHVVVFAAIIVGLNSDIGGGAELSLVFLLVGFLFYMAFDAMRTAKARQLGQTAADPLENWSKSRPVGPIILIGLGVVFLLYNFNLFPFDRVMRLFWPLALIGVGVLMFRNRLGGR